MAIGTDSAINFFGTQDTVTSSSAAVFNNAFSVVGDIVTWTNDDDAPAANVVLEVTFASAPVAGTNVALYVAPQNIQSTNDQTAPNANFLHTFLGTFPVENVTSAQFISLDVALPNTKTSSEFNFYIQNNSGQTASAGWNLYVTPKTIGPHS